MSVYETDFHVDSKGVSKKLPRAYGKTYFQMKRWALIYNLYDTADILSQLSFKPFIHEQVTSSHLRLGSAGSLSSLFLLLKTLEYTWTHVSPIQTM